MCRRTSVNTEPNPCNHLANYKLSHGVNGYISLKSSLKTISTGKACIKKHQTEIPSCNFCNGYQGRLYICLICSSISCSSHTLFHTRSNNGHDIAVDIERAELYCCSCSDQVYDPDFDKVIVFQHMMDLPGVHKNVVEAVVGRPSKRRKLDSGIGLDLKKSKQLVSLRDRRAKSCYPLGLRGLNNLGSTCFMNSVLQVLLHAPPLRNYLMSGRHDRDLCKRRYGNRLCLLCDIHVIFSAMSSGDRTPYSAAQFLYSWWQHSANLASYEQQDSHEFFISLLDGIHEKESVSPQKGCGDCQCVAHRVFSGLLRSDVTCMTCGFTSTTYDPCIDISLNLDGSNCPTDVANRSVKPNQSTGISTLLGCLDFFTRSEKLGSDQKLHCQNCQERRDSLKQMSIKRLPLVLCLHIKRFEHSPFRKMSRKIDRYLQFPFSLDMTPYLSSSIMRGRFGNRIFDFEDEDFDTSAEFEIFAVVTHSGMLESGHYVTFLRLKNQWYKCDDAWITEVDEGAVRASQGYMLFYVQKRLFFEVNEDFSCLSVPQHRDLSISIAGCC